MSCENAAKVHAYYDDELSPEDRAAVEHHFVECAECHELLAELRGLSRTIRSSSLVNIPPEAIKRLDRAWWAATNDRGVLRIAEWLTGVAAAVLIGAMLLWSRETRTETAMSPATWQVAAVMPPSETPDEPASDVIAVAQWMANDLSPAQTGQTP